MDPSLIIPLTEITDYLLRCKPGPVSILNIIKISQYYGFETFNENKRLTIAGKIILIDIDYQLTDEIIEKISISLAIDLQNVAINFMKDFDQLILNNLNELTLFKFNNNFNKLSILDKFSSLKFDLFNYLNNEVNKLPDIKINLNDNLGFFLPIYQDFKYLNEKIGTVENHYLEINIRETKTTMINDSKCGICLELINDHGDNGLIIPELVLIKLGIINYDIFDTVDIPNQLQDYKIISIIGSPLVNLKQFYMNELTELPEIIPLLQNWYFINNLLFRNLTSINEDNIEDINLDDYMNIHKSQKVIEVVLLEHCYLQLKINGIEFVIKDGKVHSDTHPTIADKLNKIEQLSKVIEFIEIV